jgi:hypothetical protein
MDGAKHVREIEISLSWEDKRFRLDALHSLLRIALIWILLRAVSSLPCLEHDKKILGIYSVLQYSGT